MLDKSTISNLNISGKNILKDTTEYSTNKYYSPNIIEYSNLILNSNLSNQNIIK